MKAIEKMVEFLKEDDFIQNSNNSYDIWKKILFKAQDLAAEEKDKPKSNIDTGAGLLTDKERAYYFEEKFFGLAKLLSKPSAPASLVEEMKEWQKDWFTGDGLGLIKFKQILTRYSTTESIVDKKAIKLIKELVSALQWCSGSKDFLPQGEARIGWTHICMPSIIEAREYLNGLPDKENK